MRRVAPFLFAAGLVLAVATPATAAPPSGDPETNAQAAAVWVANQVNDQGFIPQAADPSAPNLSSTVNAVQALAAAGVGGQQVDAMLDYLSTQVEAIVQPFGQDDPAQIANLILSAVADGRDPTAFGTPPVDLVDRLFGVQQPSGLFGATDPTFDGAYRQGLALEALHSVGQTSASGVAWLVDQQCDTGLWTAFRADTSVACPPVDPNTFTGPDTNSTALAILGLDRENEATVIADGMTALNALQNPDGGWGYLATSGQLTDANSTAAVLATIRTINGSAAAGGLDALWALQLGCDADPLDVGALAFQPGQDGELVPNLLATVQAVPALAAVALPITDATISEDLPDACATQTGSTTTTVPDVTPVDDPPTTVAIAPAAELPRTGSSSLPLFAVAIVILGAGIVLVEGTRKRRA